jgi:branched-chain amino acid transport system substrate-binding protein
VRSVSKIGKSIFTIIAAITILAVLGACSSNSPTNTTGNQKPIKIGFSISLAGDYSADGKAVLDGYELWRDAVNARGGLLGRQVQLVYYNDNSDPDQVTTNYQKLITSDKVDLLFGPFSTKLTVQAGTVAQRYGLAMIEGAGTGDKVFNSGFTTLFGASPPSSSYLGTFAQYILSLPDSQRPKTAAYAMVDNPFAVPQVAKAKELFTAGKITTAFELGTPYPEETQDVTPIAKQIIASKADIVVIGTVGAGDCVAFLKAFEQQHYSPKAFIATSGPDEGKTFTDAIGVKAAEGIFVPNAGWYPQIKNYQNDQFVADYLKKHSGSTAEDINNGSVQGYVTGQVLEQAVNKIHSIDNKQLIQELGSDLFNSLQGPVQFDKQGRNTAGVPFLFQWQNGHLLPVYPANSALANPIYPKPDWPS